MTAQYVEKYKEIQRLLPAHFKILDYVLAGYGPAQIAKLVDRTKERIGYIIMSPIFQSELARRRSKLEKMQDEREVLHIDSARKHLEEHALEAAEAQTSMLSEEDPNLRLKSSKEILDRVFGKSDDGANVTNVTVLNAQQIDNLRVTLEHLGEPAV